MYGILNLVIFHWDFRNYNYLTLNYHQSIPESAIKVILLGGPLSCRFSYHSGQNLLRFIMKHSLVLSILTDMTSKCTRNEMNLPQNIRPLSPFWTRGTEDRSK